MMCPRGHDGGLTGMFVDFRDRYQAEDVWF